MENQTNNPPTYWLTRFVLLRALGAAYAIAFLVAINQIIPLIGTHGLLPVKPGETFARRTKQRSEGYKIGYHKVSVPYGRF